MTQDLRRFREIVVPHLLREFCNDPSRNYGIDGFVESSIRVSERDAADFLRAYEAQLLLHKGRGLYRAPRSRASEQFFWQGRKDKVPRRITLWIEPIITIAVLARLHFDFKWPKELIGTQSAKWEFDVTAFRSHDQINEHIACEVKKTPRELHQLIELMLVYVSNPPQRVPTAPKELNAYRKVEGLKARQAPVFWAVGPDGASHIFKLSYGRNGITKFETATEAALYYPS